MFEVSRTVGGHVESYDLHSVKLPDGRYAHQLRGDELFRECQRMRIPGITATDGHQQLSWSLAKYIHEHPYPQAVDHRPSKVSAKEKK